MLTKKKLVLTIVTALLALIVSLYAALANVFANRTDTTTDSTDRTDEIGILPTVVESLPAPPEGFDPLTASPEELKKYGFPQRPTDPDSLAAWERAMKHAKHYVKSKQTPSTTVHDPGLYTP